MATKAWLSIVAITLAIMAVVGYAAIEPARAVADSAAGKIVVNEITTAFKAAAVDLWR